MIKLLINVCSSLWFIPSVVVLLFAAFAVLAIELDMFVADNALTH
jgi:hypothetical protein